MLVVVLVAANGFFVAAEFALVALDRSQLANRVEAGDRRAKMVERVVQRLSFHLSGAQLGITLTSLGLGFVAKPAVGALIEPVLEPVLGGSSAGFSIVLALALATVFQTVLGELVPKIIAIAKPLSMSLAVVIPFRIVSVIMMPIVHFLDGVANWIVRRLGVEPAEELAPGRSLDELEYLVRSSGEEGTLRPDEVHLLVRSIRFGDKTAADALTPRPEVETISPDASLSDLAEMSVRTGFSRFPVVGDDVDDLRGTVLVKSIYGVEPSLRSTTRVGEIATDAFVVPEGRELESILAHMRHSGDHMAVVVDEHGGTAGVITAEDLVEEVVGDIADEHDPPEITVIREAHSVVLAGSLHPDEVQEACGFEVPEGDYETLAGFAMDTLQRIPAVGEIFRHQGWNVEIVEMDRHRIVSMRLTPRTERP